jgi:hypothetical protein
LATNDPETRVIILTNNATSSFCSKTKQMNSVTHFDHVLDISMLAKRIFTELQIDFGGQIRGIALAFLLQALELEGRSCTLLVTAKAKTGMIYLTDGKPTAAKMGRLTGKPAAIQILNWQNVLIDIDYKPREMPLEIDESLMNLLLESGQILDEKLSQRHNIRQHNRYDCLVGVQYRIHDVVYQCYLRDLSEGGAYLETEQSVEIGQWLTVSLYSPMLERTSEIHGRVVRLEKKGIGIRFEELVPEQKQVIHALIESCCTPIANPSVSD